MRDERAAVVSDRDALRTATADAPDDSRVVVEAHVPVEDSFVAYRRARGDEPGFYYETTGGSDGWGYFGVSPAAFLTVGPGEDGALDALTERIGETVVRGTARYPTPAGCSAGSPTTSPANWRTCPRTRPTTGAAARAVRRLPGRRGLARTVRGR